jgi:hypothetical protein
MPVPTGDDASARLAASSLEDLGELTAQSLKGLRS